MRGEGRKSYMLVFFEKIYQVNGDLLKLLLENGYVPVVSLVAIGEEFELLNVDGDRAAAALLVH